ncbi:Uncharacterised protein [Enterobacter cloacae]|nr:Uncharacterised protein [Enterobacter cloacae]
MLNPTTKHHLPQLYIPRAERTRAGIQIIAKHPFESFRIVVGDFRPCSLETFMPGHQRGVVICAEVMPVFHNKMRFAGVRYLANRG